MSSVSGLRSGVAALILLERYSPTEKLRPAASDAAMGLVPA